MICTLQRPQEVSTESRWVWNAARWVWNAARWVWNAAFHTHHTSLEIPATVAPRWPVLPSVHPLAGQGSGRLQAGQHEGRLVHMGTGQEQTEDELWNNGQSIKVCFNLAQFCFRCSFNILIRGVCIIFPIIVWLERSFFPKHNYSMVIEHISIVQPDQILILYYTGARAIYIKSFNFYLNLLVFLLHHIWHLRSVWLPAAAAETAKPLISDPKAAFVEITAGLPKLTAAFRLDSKRRKRIYGYKFRPQTHIYGFKCL